LQQTGLQGFAKTSGGKGIHVVVPLQRRQAWQDIRTFASTLAHQMTHDSPGSYTLSPAKDLRQQRIYLDTLRNSPGATTICPYSTRARYGAPVSTPVTWSELPRLVSADQFNLGNLAERLAHLTADPWEEFRSVRQSLGKSPWKQLRAQ